MAARAADPVQDQDVYVLSPKGEEELRGSETSLSPAEIELLVRLDGKSSVAEIAKEAQLPGREPVTRALGRLLEAGLVVRAAAEGIPDLFDSISAPAPDVKAMTRAKAVAASGVSSLERQGYFVRIAKRRSDVQTQPRPGTYALVVEDEPHLAKFLKQYLSFDGFDVKVALSRSELNAVLRQPPLPDVVLLDVMLPDGDGFDILQKMRAHPALKDVPVVMMTAKATRAAVIKGLACGADGYVTKPFEPDALLKAVKTVLGLSKDRNSGGAGGAAWTIT